MATDHPPTYAEAQLRPISPSFYTPQIRDFQPPVAPRPHNSDTASTLSKQLPAYTSRGPAHQKSQTAYLDALRSWAAEKELATVTDDALVGFYGHRTMTEYLPATKQRKLEERLKSGRKGRHGSQSSSDGSDSSAESKKKGWFGRKLASEQ